MGPSRRRRFALIEVGHESKLFHAPDGRDDCEPWAGCGGDAAGARHPGRPRTTRARRPRLPSVADGPPPGLLRGRHLLRQLPPPPNGGRSSSRSRSSAESSWSRNPPGTAPARPRSPTEPRGRTRRLDAMAQTTSMCSTSSTANSRVAHRRDSWIWLIPEDGYASPFASSFGGTSAKMAVPTGPSRGRGAAVRRTSPTSRPRSMPRDQQSPPEDAGTSTRPPDAAMSGFPRGRGVSWAASSRACSPRNPPGLRRPPVPGRGHSSLRGRAR